MSKEERYDKGYEFHLYKYRLLSVSLSDSRVIFLIFIRYRWLLAVSFWLEEEIPNDKIPNSNVAWGGKFQVIKFQIPMLLGEVFESLRQANGGYGFG